MIRRTWRAACCAVLVVGIASAQAPDGPAVAVVNGVKVPLAALEAELQAAPLGDPAAGAPTRARRMEALGLLIDNLLLQQFLDRNSPSVPPEEVSKRLADFEAGLLARRKSLADFCNETNQTPDQVRAGIVQQMRWSTYVNAQMNDEALDRYYRENREVFDKVTVRASHIVLRVPPGASEAEKGPIRARLRELRKQLQADPSCDFAALARKHSHGPHAASGGDVGYFPRKWVFDEQFSRAAFSLPVGQVSDVVETEYGLHLIKVTDRRAGEPRDLARAREEVRAFCSEELRQKIIAEQREAARRARAITIELP